MNVVLEWLSDNDVDTAFLAVPFAVLAITVLHLRTSAGLSQKFVVFSVTGAILRIVTSRQMIFMLTNFTQFVSLLALLFAIRSWGPVTSGRFRDSPLAYVVVPMAVVFAIPALFDRGLRGFAADTGVWLQILAIGSQVFVTRQSRQVQVLGKSLTMFLPAFLLRVACLFHRAFETDGSEMWISWIGGMTALVLSIDIGYYAANARKRTEFDLPNAFGEM